MNHNYHNAPFAEKWSQYKNTLLDGKRRTGVRKTKTLHHSKKLIHCIVCPPAKWFLYHVIGSLAMIGIITRLFTAPPFMRSSNVCMERLKFFVGGGGDSTSTNHYYLNEVLVRPRYSHVTLVGGYPFLTITWMSNTKLDTDSICLGLLVSKSAISHPLT